MNVVTVSSLVIAIGLIFTAPSHADVVFSITPDTQSVSTGSNVSFAVDISGLGSGTALGSYDLSLGFDSTLLSFTQATFGDPVLGDQLDLAITGLNSPLATPSTASVNLIEFSFDDPATLVAQQAGSFTLAILSFSGITAGTSALTLTVNSISDAYGNTIQYTTPTTSAVPLPGALWLFMSACPALLLTKRRR